MYPRLKSPDARAMNMPAMTYLLSAGESEKLLTCHKVRAAIAKMITIAGIAAVLG